MLGGRETMMSSGSPVVPFERDVVGLVAWFRHKGRPLAGVQSSTRSARVNQRGQRASVGATGALCAHTAPGSVSGS
jgi:hypothetical protein